MDEPAHTKSTFSPYRKWGFALQLVLVVGLVFSVVVMANYLSRDYFKRVHLGGNTRTQLSAHTTRLLQSLTNEVKITLYYDRTDSLYSMVADLLNEYHLVNPRIHVQTVDYLRDPAVAQKTKAEYKLLSAGEKNLVIFDCAGRVKMVEGGMLAQYTLEQIPNEKDREFRRKPVSFQGEKAFTASLIAVSSPRPLKACFLTGHNEHSIDSGDDLVGYLQFAAVLQQNYITNESLSLVGTNQIPADCNLLVVAGPTTPLLDIELQKIEQYLNEGGRLLALFNSETRSRPTGLEKVLNRWGVEVGSHIAVDPEHTASGSEVIVSAFTKHPLVNPLLGSGLYLIRPLSISKTSAGRPAADAPKVDEVAFTGPKAFLFGANPPQPQQLPLMVAVEKGAVKDVTTERGTTRIIVVGDSMFLGNHQLDLLANRDFAGYAANWLLDRAQLLEGLGPTPVNEYRLVMTRAQLQSAEWILLAGLPGGVLLIGGLVWLRRRS